MTSTPETWTDAPKEIAALQRLQAVVSAFTAALYAADIDGTAAPAGGHDPSK